MSTEDSSTAASPVPEVTPPPVVTSSDDVGLITEDSSSLGLLAAVDVGLISVVAEETDTVGTGIVGTGTGTGTVGTGTVGTGTGTVGTGTGTGTVGTGTEYILNQMNCRASQPPTF